MDREHFFCRFAVLLPLVKLMACREGSLPTAPPPPKVDPPSATGPQWRGTFGSAYEYTWPECEPREVARVHFLQRGADITFEFDTTPCLGSVTILVRIHGDVFHGTLTANAGAVFSGEIYGTMTSSTFDLGPVDIVGRDGHGTKVGTIPQSAFTLRVDRTRQRTISALLENS